ncbi:MAG: type II toxin-antitoxin system HipA family toxin [Xanthomonadales bacterium]|nr:type II toxin-antitoxin system HipA family toxin [Xanthomonadales bacterium]
MKQIEVRLQFAADHVLHVGRLAETGRHLYFEYDPAFVARGLQISPFKLALQPGVIEHRDRAFGPLPGVFDDSLPDGWGRLLMDRHFRRQGLDPERVSALDRLTWLGTRSLGALTYHPPLDAAGAGAEPLDLRLLLRHAGEVLAGEAREVLPQLLRVGGSPAGAHPKVLVGLRGDQVLSGADELPDGFRHWLVKFAARGELADAGPIEHAYSQMATAAGIDLPPTRLITLSARRRCFAVQRFDRLPGGRRLHLHSLANLLHADFRVPSLDYADLFRATQVLTRNHGDLLRAFRRMLFNIAAHNRDDHGKNFAFLMDADGRWALSPAYDVVFSHGPGGEHSTTVAGEGRAPTIAHAETLARQHGLRPRELATMREAVNAAIARWPEFADTSGCSAKAAREVAAHLRLL